MNQTILKLFSKSPGIKELIFTHKTETKTEDAITAGIWFSTVLFESGVKCSREFILESLKLAFESGKADWIIPNWYSFGIFTPVSRASTVEVLFYTNFVYKQKKGF